MSTSNVVNFRNSSWAWAFALEGNPCELVIVEFCELGFCDEFWEFEVGEFVSEFCEFEVEIDVVDIVVDVIESCFVIYS